jgi:hypothetical protein
MKSGLAVLCLICRIDAAEIFGKQVSQDDKPEVLLAAIAEGYAKAHGLLPTEAELEPMRKQFGKPVRGLDFAYQILLHHKLNQALWPKHGGRLVLSAFGVHVAADAMLKEVGEMEKAGNVKFTDADSRKKFVGYLEGYQGDGVVTGERAREVLADVSLKLGSRSDGKHR